MDFNENVSVELEMFTRVMRKKMVTWGKIDFGYFCWVANAAKAGLNIKEITIMTRDIGRSLLVIDCWLGRMRCSDSKRVITSN